VDNQMKSLYYKFIYFSIALVVYGLYTDINLRKRSIRIHFLQI